MNGKQLAGCRLALAKIQSQPPLRAMVRARTNTPRSNGARAACSAATLGGMALHISAPLLGCNSPCALSARNFRSQGLPRGRPPKRSRCAGNHLRRPRDSLYDRSPQAKVNLDWTRARSKRARPPRKRVRETMAVLDGVLRDPGLMDQLDKTVTSKVELPASLAAAIKRTAQHVLGGSARVTRQGSRQAGTTCFRAVAGTSDFDMWVSLPDRSISRYERFAVAERLRATMGAARVDVGRCAITLTLEGEAGAATSVDIVLGGANPSRSRKSGEHPCPHLTVMQDEAAADHVSTQFVEGSSRAGWAIAMLRHLCRRRDTDKALSGCSSLTQDGILSDTLLKNLALRIRERDACQQDRQEVLGIIDAAGRRLQETTTELWQGQHEMSPAPGRIMLLSMASELLDWSRSGILQLWLKDAEQGGGPQGRARAESLLRQAGENLEMEVWGLGHTQICPMPPETDETLQGSIDREICCGVRLIHFGCFDEAEACLGRARHVLQMQMPWPNEALRLLSLAEVVSSSVMLRRKGHTAQADSAMQQCAAELQCLRPAGVARPLASCHHLALLLRDPLSSMHGAGHILPAGTPRQGRIRREHSDLDRDSLADTAEPAYPDAFGYRFLDGLDPGAVHRTEDICRFLMPLTVERLGVNSREALRIHVGIAKALVAL